MTRAPKASRYRPPSRPNVLSGKPFRGGGGGPKDVSGNDCCCRGMGPKVVSGNDALEVSGTETALFAGGCGG